VKANITRCCNNYGPYQHYEKLIPTIIDCIINNKKIPIYGDGSNIREWIHVTDHCKAIWKVLTNGVDGEIYNVGTKAEFTNLQLTELILSLSGASNASITYVQDRPGHDFRYSINSEKIEKSLGFTPTIDLEIGLIKTIEWYKNKFNV